VLDGRWERPEIVKFLIKQVYGRPPQRIELSANIPPEIQIRWQTSEIL
jgi:hypothetical protein